MEPIELILRTQCIMKGYEGRLVPVGILRLWHAAGLLPYPLLTDRASPLYTAVTRLLRSWSLTILLLYVYFYAIELIVFGRAYHAELTKLEFFTMILSAYREYFFVLPILMLLAMLIWARSFSAMLSTVEAGVSSFLESTQIRVVNVFHYASWAFLLTVTAGSVVCIYAGIALMIQELVEQEIYPNEHYGWAQQQSIEIFPGGTLSNRAMVFVYGIGYSYATLCWSAPPILLAGVVLAVGLAFANLGKELKNVSKDIHVKCKHVDEVCLKISRIQSDHRQVRKAVSAINNAVAFIVILSTLGDIIMPVSLISRILQEDPLDPNAKYTNECMKYSVYFFSVCATLQSIVRIAIFVWMHEKAFDAKAHLHHINYHAADADIRDAARNFEQEIEENREELSVSGNGFFSITKHFAATLFGVILTYFLVIYEKKDELGDLQALSEQHQEAFLYLSAQIDNLPKIINETLSAYSNT